MLVGGAANEDVAPRCAFMEARVRRAGWRERGRTSCPSAAPESGEGVSM